VLYKLAAAFTARQTLKAAELLGLLSPAQVAARTHGRAADHVVTMVNALADALRENLRQLDQLPREEDVIAFYIAHLPEQGDADLAQMQTHMLNLRPDEDVLDVLTRLAFSAHEPAPTPRGTTAVRGRPRQPGAVSGPARAQIARQGVGRADAQGAPRRGLMCHACGSHDGHMWMTCTHTQVRRDQLRPERLDIYRAFSEGLLPHASPALRELMLQRLAPEALPAEYQQRQPARTTAAPRQADAPARRAAHSRDAAAPGRNARQRTTNEHDGPDLWTAHAAHDAAEPHTAVNFATEEHDEFLAEVEDFDQVEGLGDDDRSDLAFFCMHCTTRPDYAMIGDADRDTPPEHLLAPKHLLAPDTTRSPLAHGSATHDAPQIYMLGFAPSFYLERAHGLVAILDGGASVCLVKNLDLVQYGATRVEPYHQQLCGIAPAVTTRRGQIRIRVGDLRIAVSAYELPSLPIDIFAHRALFRALPPGSSLEYTGTRLIFRTPGGSAWFPVSKTDGLTRFIVAPDGILLPCSDEPEHASSIFVPTAAIPRCGTCRNCLLWVTHKNKYKDDNCYRLISAVAMLARDAGRDEQRDALTFPAHASAQQPCGATGVRDRPRQPGAGSGSMHAHAAGRVPAAPAGARARDAGGARRVLRGARGF
jgi:hypothetical protein